LDFSKIKRVHIKCLNSVLCDPFDDTITFERFCRVVSLFGPLQPIESFFLRIKELLSKPYFHGYFNASKAAHLVKNTWAQTSSKSPCYLYRFSSTDLGGMVLTYIDKKGEIYHKKIQKTDRGFKIEDLQLEDQSNISKVHKICKQTFKIKKVVPDSPYSILFRK